MIQVSVEELTTGLLTGFVQSPFCGADDFFQLSTDPASPSGRKLLLYQFALVLTAVLEAEKYKPAFTTVRRCLEKYFFLPQFAGTENYDFDEVVNAIGDIGELIEAIQSGSNSRVVMWAQRWFNAIGLAQDNPIFLGTFAHNWIRRYLTVKKFLWEVEPVC